MPVNDNLGQRMKTFYEQVPKYKLYRRTPVAIRIDGKANFSHNELQGKSCNMIQDMLHEQHGINWNDYPTRWKRGVAWTKEKGVDFEIPILKGEDRKYIDELIFVGG